MKVAGIVRAMGAVTYKPAISLEENCGSTRRIAFINRTVEGQSVCFSVDHVQNGSI